MTYHWPLTSFGRCRDAQCLGDVLQRKVVSWGVLDEVQQDLLSTLAERREIMHPSISYHHFTMHPG